MDNRSSATAVLLYRPASVLANPDTAVESIAILSPQGLLSHVGLAGVFFHMYLHQPRDSPFAPSHIMLAFAV